MCVYRSPLLSVLLYVPQRPAEEYIYVYFFTHALCARNHWKFLSICENPSRQDSEIIVASAWRIVCEILKYLKFMRCIDVNEKILSCFYFKSFETPNLQVAKIEKCSNIEEARFLIVFSYSFGSLYWKRLNIFPITIRIARVSSIITSEKRNKIKWLILCYVIMLL